MVAVAAFLTTDAILLLALKNSRLTSARSARYHFQVGQGVWHAHRRAPIGCMDELGIILLTLFMVLLVCGPLYRPVRLTYLRIQDRRKYHPKTSKFQDARRKLSTVSECNSTTLEGLDLESKLNRHDSEPECPICIGPLFVSSNCNAAGAVPTQGITLTAPDFGGHTRVLEGSGEETSRSTVGGHIAKLEYAVAVEEEVVRVCK
ncbi:hypothetical protein JMJ78_0008374 [Colletotrichum scovillei]|nr:hypothetical protein JMJ78_0008374 [Colletotrichum scovillei]